MDVSHPSYAKVVSSKRSHVAKDTKGTFETLTLIKGVNYWIYWAMVGLLIFLLGEILSVRFASESYLWDRLIFSCGCFILPASNIWARQSFSRRMNELSTLFWTNQTEFAEWLQSEVSRTFTLKPLPAKVVTGFIMIAGMVTVLRSVWHSPINGTGIVLLVMFLLYLEICSQTLYSSIGQLVALHKIAQLPTHVPFFLLPHYAVTRLQNHFSSAALLVTSFYIGLVIAIWQSPFRFSNSMIAWATALALYPLAMYVWSFYELHTLVLNIKTSHVLLINHEVEQALKDAKEGHGLQDMQRLETAMSVQEKVQGIKEWPIDLKGSLTLAIALVTAIVQVVLAVMNVLKH